MGIRKERKTENEGKEKPKFCPVCCHNLEEPLDCKFEIKPLPSSEEIKEEIRRTEGVLFPEENSPRNLPKKNPYCDEEGITLFTHWDGEYFIEWGRVKKAEDLLMFVHHLTEKCWINRRNIKYLIEKASIKHGFGYFKTTGK